MKPTSKNHLYAKSSSSKDSDSENPTGFVAGIRIGDFSTRAAKIRLFAMVCAVMFVLVLMFEARKPENWNWMGFQKAEAPIDTRYLSNLYTDDNTTTDSPLEQRDSGAPPSNSEAASSQQDLSKESSKSPSGTGQEKSSADAAANKDPSIQSGPLSDRSPQLVQAEDDLWKKCYLKLNFRQRMLLLEGLYRATRGGLIDEEQSSEWMRMIDEFSLANERYQADVLNYVASLGQADPERASLTRTVIAMQQRWLLFYELLLEIGNRQDGGIKSLDVLAEFQELVDKTAMSFVQDNSLQSFSDDQPAMFRLVDRIQNGEIRLGGTEAEEVLFSQMYKETDRLRGQAVTFEGLIRGAYPATPAPNYLNLNKLYVWWIQLPGSNNPVAVYSLRQPNDFVTDIDESSAKKPAELREKVRVTGILFQKMVYAAEDGQRIAPVVFTDELQWIPKPKVEENEQGLPGLTWMVGILLGLGGGLALMTWIFVGVSNRTHSKQIAELKSRFEEADDQSF